MAQTLITNASLNLTGPNAEGRADILRQDGNIVAIGRDLVNEAAATFDAEGLSVAAGLIDLQVNGAWGHDLTSDPECVWELGAKLASVGVTRWLPTLVSASPVVMEAALAATAAGPPDGWTGAMPVGWHFEGPWLNPERRGAHKLAAIRAPAEGLDQARAATMATVAPELPGSLEFIAELASNGVTVSLGHTAATAAETRAGLAAGATMGTHLFNAMTGLSHRSPGAAAALLDDGHAWLGMIVDHEHVAPELVRIAWRAAHDRIVLVSDSMAATGLPEGTSTLSHQHVVVAHGSARLADGTLAGSVITLRDGVANLISTVGCHPSAALAAASLSPARAIGLENVGSFEVGSAADLVLFGSDLSVAATFVGGVEAYLNSETGGSQRWKS